MSPQERLLQYGRELLAELRGERQKWKRLDVELGKNEEGHVRDGHELERLRLTWALRFDGETGDGELARYALEQEIEWREQAPFQGIGETMETLASMVARQRRVEDVWLMLRAKRANFDASCGFDREHLVAAGVAATLAYVSAAADRSEEARQQVRELLHGDDGACLFTEEDVARWLERQERGYSRDVSSDPGYVWADRALAVDDRELARELLMAWSASCEHERDAEFLSILANRLGELGCYDEEATARDERLLILSTPFDRAGERVNIAAAARKSQQWRRAIDHLDHAALLHRPRAAWRELGLGRELVNESYLLAVDAAGSGELSVAARAYAVASEFAPQTPRLAPVTLEAQAKAAAQLAAR